MGQDDGMRAYLAATVHDTMGKLMDRPSEFLPQLESVFDGLTIVATAESSPVVVDYLRRAGWPFSTTPRKAGIARREALRLAVEAGADIIQVTDLFQALHWVDIKGEELASTVEAGKRWHLTVIGRAEAVMEGFPRPMREAHRLTGLFTEAAFGEKIDLVSGCRVLSRDAAEAILLESVAVGAEVDGEWVAIVKRSLAQPPHTLEVIGLRHFDEAFGLISPENPGPRVDWRSPHTWILVLEACIAACRASIRPPG